MVVVVVVVVGQVCFGGELMEVSRRGRYEDEVSERARARQEQANKHPTCRNGVRYDISPSLCALVDPPTTFTIHALNSPVGCSASGLLLLARRQDRL